MGQDILDGVFLVLDWDNQQIGFANSTVMDADASFTVPYSTSSTPTPSSTPIPTCSHTTANETIDPFITGCTEEGFEGTCHQIQVAYPGCTKLDS
jgi:hypothetical protein